MKNLWQLHNQMLLIISQKGFTNLNVRIMNVFLNMKVSKKLNKIETTS